MKNYAKALYVCCLLLLMCSNYNCYDLKDESKYYFCQNKLFISDQRISLADIDQMCSRISNDYRMLIAIQKDIDSNMHGGAADSYYTRESEEFFLRQCNRLNKGICDYGYMISIYTTARKVRIVAGKVSKNVVTVEMRNNIINNIKYQLSRDQWSEAVTRAVDLIQSYSPYQQPQPYPYPNPNPIYIPPHKKESSGTFWIVFIFIICPICLCCIYLMYRKKEQENEIHNLSSHSHHIYTADGVRRYFRKLMELLEDIRKNSPPIKSTKKCVLCMEKIKCQVQPTNINTFSTTGADNYYNPPNYNPNYTVQQPLIQNDPFNTRFACGHVYHNYCLTECRLQYCLMCTDQPNSTVIIPNTGDDQYVDENQIRTLISNLNIIYDKNCLQEYATAYPQEFNNYNSSLALGLVGVWGITAVATSAIMMTEMNHNYYNQGYYNQGYGYQDYGNNYNPNYNAGGYNQGTNYTDNVNTASGDFGGGDNDVDTAGQTFR